MLDQLLMQANVTLIPSVPATGDAFAAAEGFVIAISTLITSVLGFVIYILTKREQAGKLSEEQKQNNKKMQEIAKGVIMGLQKTTESIGEVRDLSKTIYDMNTTPEQKEWVEKNVTPAINRGSERLDKANQQTEIVKNALIQLLGDGANVDNDPNLPRESKGVSSNLRDVNKFGVEGSETK